VCKSSGWLFVFNKKPASFKRLKDQARALNVLRADACSYNINSGKEKFDADFICIRGLYIHYWDLILFDGR